MDDFGEPGIISQKALAETETANQRVRRWLVSMPEIQEEQTQESLDFYW